MIATIVAYGAAAGTAGLLTGLIHLLIILIIIAIVYYLGAMVIGRLGGEGIITTLWMALCALIALYFVITFLLSMAPA